ncbi:hypothetical protein B0H17DRAFT_1266690 [Mycena rosella]|uniref:Uncharacterized protein n=1 Tax=Mycena rosella TaxID=1033263 RepID=A0AAD7DQ10_MYCRO|nr:hypothetical protein B0H17DRAFT_1266690 [Mycena rosella]
MYGYIASLLTPAFRFICGSVLRRKHVGVLAPSAGPHLLFAALLRRAYFLRMWSCTAIMRRLLWATMCVRICTPPTILRTWRRVRSTFWQPRMRTPRRIRWSWHMCGFPAVERVARGRWARSRIEHPLEVSGCLLAARAHASVASLDETPAHSVLGPSMPRMPPILLQSRARAVSAAAQFCPLPALESAPRPVPEIRVARIEAAHKLPAPPPAEPIRHCTARHFLPFPRIPPALPSNPRRFSPAAPGAPSKSRRFGARVTSNRARVRIRPCGVHTRACAVFPRGAAPSAVCLHGELGYWHAAATASLCERSRPHERQVAPLQLCSIVTRRPCREFCGRRPGPACTARPRHIPACGTGHGSIFPPRPLPISPPRLLSPMRSLSVPISTPPTKLLLDAASPGGRLRVGFGRVARRRAGIQGERVGCFAQDVGNKLGTRKYHVESQLHSNRRLTNREFRRARNLKIWTCQSGGFGGDVGLQEHVISKKQHSLNAHTE